MNSRERVRAALAGKQPDRIPYCELGIDPAFSQKLMGWPASGSQAADLEAQPYTIDQARSIASRLGMDNIYYVLRAPVYAAKTPGVHGRLFYGEGMIRSASDLSLLELPDPHQDAFYAEAEEFLSRKEDYSAWMVSRMGIYPTMLSMGIEGFCFALKDDLPLVETVLDQYCNWAAAVAERSCRLGFDVLVFTDDLAFKTGPFFSPKVFRDLVLPRYRRVAERITIPWIIHSDGNVMPFLDDMIDLGIAGLHPVEKGAMDIRAVKKTHGEKICLLGNVDLNLLGLGSPEEVELEVRQLIRDVGPGGGYILSSGNSLAAYLAPENVVAMTRTLQKYGRYPLSVTAG